MVSSNAPVLFCARCLSNLLFPQDCFWPGGCCGHRLFWLYFLMVSRIDLPVALSHSEDDIGLVHRLIDLIDQFVTLLLKASDPWVVPAQHASQVLDEAYVVFYEAVQDSFQLRYAYMQIRPLLVDIVLNGSYDLIYIQPLLFLDHHETAVTIV